MGSARFVMPISRLLRPKPHLCDPRLHTASGGYLGQGWGVWGRKDTKPLSQRPSITNMGHARRILVGQQCLQVHGTPPPPHIARPEILDLSQNHRSVRARISHVTAEPRTTTLAEGFSHPMGTCTEVLGGVCKDSHANILPVEAKTPPW